MVPHLPHAAALPLPFTTSYPPHLSSRYVYKNVGCDKRKYTKATERSPVGGGHGDTQDFAISSYSFIPLQLPGLCQQD